MYSLITKGENMNTTLNFRSSKKLRKLAKETMKHDKFKVPYKDETTSEKGFFFVKDEGIYLMNAYKSESNSVVYAVGFNPSTNENCWDESYYAVGGDDFAELLPFDEDALIRIMRGGSVELKVTDKYIEVIA